MTIYNIKTGYYQLGKRRYRSKIDAMLANTGEHVQWIFNNDEFSKWDWTKEPTDSLETLYRQRAQQLRDSYDHLALFYSGGSDSNNILNIFLRNNIRLDEVVVYWPLELTKNIYTPTHTDFSQNNWLSEWDLVLKPDLQWLAANHPEIKITFVDISESTVSAMENITEDWFVSRASLSPSGPSTIDKYGKYHAVTEHITGRLKTAYIRGIDKPKIMYRDSEYYVFFIDKIINHMDWTGVFDQNTVLEFFYWSPDCVPLMIKQAQIVKKFFEDQPSLRWMISGHSSKKSEAITAYHNIVKPLIYPYWRSSIFQAGKLDSREQMDQITMHLYPEHSVETYYQGWEKFIGAVDPKYIDSDTNDTVGFVSQFYKL